MSTSKSAKEVVVKRKDELPVELESQLILRLPEGPCHELRKALKSGSNTIKERLSIQLENDMRHGTVRFDNYVWAAKIVDLPCVLETHKSIDRKTFYKTADVCQMLICKDDDDSQTTEEEDNTKKKDKKELLKVEKKYQWPHGITPPLKNVRKRRFRKTLKKKYVDAPEIEKEVKRLFRVDNEAVSVKWQVITEDEDGTKPTKTLMGESLNSSVASPAISGPLFSNSQSLDIAEHDIFGGVVSSSEDEGEVNIVDSGDDEASQMSTMDHESDSKPAAEDLMFSKRVLQEPSSSTSTPTSSATVAAGEYFGQVSADNIQYLEEAGIAKKDLLTNEPTLKSERREDLLEKLGDLRRQLLDLHARRQAQQLDLASIDNQALKQRLQPVLDRLIEEEKEKQREYEEISSLLKN